VPVTHQPSHRTPLHHHESRRPTVDTPPSRPVVQAQAAPNAAPPPEPVEEVVREVRMNYVESVSECAFFYRLCGMQENTFCSRTIFLLVELRSHEVGRHLYRDMLDSASRYYSPPGPRTAAA
jgi:hypothetical protein